MATKVVYYRIVWQDGRFRYYANRLNTVTSPPRVRWSRFEDEYPDKFFWSEVVAIREFYSGQKLTVEEVYLAGEEDK